MPDKKTIQRAERDKQAGKSAGTQAGDLFAIEGKYQGVKEGERRSSFAPGVVPAGPFSSQQTDGFRP